REGQAGKSSRTRCANCSTYCRSNSSRRTASRSLRRSLISLSARHSSSAFSSACSSTSSPCLSYRFRARLHFKTTAESVDCFFARRVHSASPEGRKTRGSRSAQDRHNAPFSPTSVIQALEPRFSPHSPQVESRDEMKTLISSMEFGCEATRVFVCQKVFAEIAL